MQLRAFALVLALAIASGLACGADSAPAGTDDAAGFGDSISDTESDSGAEAATALRLVVLDAGANDLTREAEEPINGWLVLNHLEDAVVFYDDAGVAIGHLTVQRGLEPVRGSQRPVATNPVMRSLIDELSKANDDELAGFLDEFGAAVDSKSLGGDVAFSILMSPPMAVVRIGIAIDADAGAPGNGTAAPQLVRLGSDDQPRDGVVGYWIESASAGFGPFQAAGTALDPTGDGSQLGVTVLVDATGTVRGSVNGLASATVSVPAEAMLVGLEQIVVDLLTQPVITTLTIDELMLPTSAASIDQWLGLDDNAENIWSEDAVAGRVTFDPVEGWLELDDTGAPDEG